MFNENNMIVRLWVSRIRQGIKTRDQVPDVGNLREVVFKVLDPERE